MTHARRLRLLGVLVPAGPEPPWGVFGAGGHEIWRIFWRREWRAQWEVRALAG